jgi:17 kDa outer membrane surface antigen
MARGRPKKKSSRPGASTPEMKMPKLPRFAVALLAATMTVAAATPVVAQGHGPDDNRPGAHGNGGPGSGGPGNANAPHGEPMHRGGPVAVPAGRVKMYRNIRVVRPHGHWYAGYGRYVRDEDAYRWLAFTAITLAVLDTLSEAQQRAHEQAQIRATTAPIHETIVWHDGNATGSVTPVREGTTSAGRYCREFQQTVTIGGKTEHAYGTACQQPDGAWEIVSTGE